MKVLSKILVFTMIIGVLLVVAGFMGGLSVDTIVDYLNEDESYGEMITYETELDIQDLVVEMENRHINIEIDQRDNILIEYYAHEDDTWIILEDENQLSITQDYKNIFQFFTFFKFSSREKRTVNIYLPEDMVDQMDIRTEVGDISLEANQSTLFTQVKLRSETGDIHISEGTYQSIFSQTSTGDHHIEDLETLSLNAKSETGYIVIENLIAESVLTDFSTGDITLIYTQISNQLTAETSTGDIKIYDSISQAYDLDSSTGNILYKHVTNQVNFDFLYNLSVSTGVIRINGASQGNRHTSTTGSIVFKAHSDTGNITIQYVIQ